MKNYKVQKQINSETHATRYIVQKLKVCYMTFYWKNMDSCNAFKTLQEAEARASELNEQSGWENVP